LSCADSSQAKEQNMQSETDRPEEKFAEPAKMTPLQTREV